VVDPSFNGLRSPERYRLAQRGGRLPLPRGNSIRGIRADVKALMHTLRQFACDTPLGLVAFLGNFQTACDGSGLKEGTAVTLLQYFVTSEVLGVLQRAKDTHASQQLTYKRAVHALLNEYLDEDDLVDHLQSLVEAAPQARVGKSELPRTAWIVPGVLMRSSACLAVPLSCIAVTM